MLLIYHDIDEQDHVPNAFSSNNSISYLPLKLSLEIKYFTFYQWYRIEAINANTFFFYTILSLLFKLIYMSLNSKVS